MSRQSASTWLARLKKNGIIESTGAGRGTSYHLVNTVTQQHSYVRAGLSEDTVWRDQCAPVVADLAENVRRIWHHGVTEMVNNAIDHSEAESVLV
ncbi:STAS-like domain-containing protein, partial [Glaciimonas sp. GG7]